MRVCVLGAGLSGLSTAHVLANNGIEVDVFEKQDVVGGLAKTLTRDGFTADLGPHRFHSKNKELIKLVGGWIDDKWAVLERKSRIYMEGKFFDYPLKASNAILTMPPLVSAQILLDYLKTAISRRIAPRQEISFEDWVINRFGRKLYDIYFGPYNEKLWGIHPTKMSKDWAAQRITLLNLWDTVVKTVFKTGDEPRTLVSQFHYPLNGGIVLVSEKLKERIERTSGRIYLGTDVRSVNMDDERVLGVTFKENGKEETREYDLVLSSIPITSLIKLIRPKVPGDVLGHCENLKFKAIVFAYVTVDKKSISDDHWVYIPQKGLIFNRVSEPKNFSKNNVPSGKNILCAEITCDVGDSVWNTPEEQLRERVVGDLEKLGFITKKDVEGFFVHREEHAYPVYDLDYEQNLDIVTSYLGGLDNIVSIGRNGLFRYDNMDHSLEMGLLAGRAIIEETGDTQRIVDKIAREEEYFG